MPVPGDFIGAFLPQGMCPLCARANLPYFLRECDGGAPCLRFEGPGNPPSIDMPLDDGLTGSLVSALDDPALAWLGAGEPPSALRADAIRLVGYRPDARWLELVVLEGPGALSSYSGVQGFIDGDPSAVDRALLFSGNHATVYAIGGSVAGQPLQTLRAFDLVTGAVTDIGTSLGEVVAASLHVAGRRAAVLERVANDELRIVQLDLTTGDTYAMMTAVEPATFGRYELTSLADGRYALLSYNPWEDDYRVLVFDLTDQVLERSFYQGNAHVLGGLRGDSASISLVVEAEEGAWAPRTVPSESLEPAGDGWIDAMF